MILALYSFLILDANAIMVQHTEVEKNGGKNLFFTKSIWRVMLIATATSMVILM